MDGGSVSGTWSEMILGTKMLSMADYFQLLRTSVSLGSKFVGIALIRQPLRDGDHEGTRCGFQILIHETRVFGELYCLRILIYLTLRTDTMPH